MPNEQTVLLIFLGAILEGVGWGCRFKRALGTIGYLDGRNFFFLFFLIFRSRKGANEENDLILLHYVRLKNKNPPMSLKIF